MRRTQDLGNAYWCLGEVNILNQRLHGKPMPEALYNQACCLALGAGALLAGSGVPVPMTADAAATVTPGLPPSAKALGCVATVGAIVEHRLDMAIDVLAKAIHEGYADSANMMSDLDLQVLRERRPTEFATVVRQLHLLRGK